MAEHTNFLLMLIIVSLAMFILLCPRKSDTITLPEETFDYHSNMVQQQPQYLPPEVELVPNSNRTGYEFTKATAIQQMNMDYDTRGDINDLVNLNQLPHEGTMFVYP